LPALNSSFSHPEFVSRETLFESFPSLCRSTVRFVRPSASAARNQNDVSRETMTLRRPVDKAQYTATPYVSSPASSGGSLERRRDFLLEVRPKRHVSRETFLAPAQKARGVVHSVFELLGRLKGVAARLRPGDRVHQALDVLDTLDYIRLRHSLESALS
jgi:hypothetical protein